jgi:hypothetical protein
VSICWSATLIWKFVKSVFYPTVQSSKFSHHTIWNYCVTIPSHAVLPILQSTVAHPALYLLAKYRRNEVYKWKMWPSWEDFLANRFEFPGKLASSLERPIAEFCLGKQTVFILTSKRTPQINGVSHLKINRAVLALTTGLMSEKQNNMKA